MCLNPNPKIIQYESYCMIHTPMCDPLHTLIHQFLIQLWAKALSTGIIVKKLRDKPFIINAFKNDKIAISARH